MSSRTGLARWSAVLTALLIAANLIVANLILAKFQIRHDLTRDKRYEIGTGTSRILERIKDTVAVKCYVSSNLPKRLSHVQRTLFEKLKEYEREGGDKLIFEFVDPETSADVKRECDDLGFQPIPMLEYDSGTTPRTVQCYAALVFRHLDRKSQLNLFDELRESVMEPARFAADLEYFLTSNIQKVANEKKTVGIVAEVHEIPLNPNDQRSEKRKTQGLDNLKLWLERSYDVSPVDTKELNAGKPIPPEISTIIVFRPQGFTEVGAYQLDQFVMRGGSALFLVDTGQVDVNPRPKQTQLGRQMVQDFDMPTYGGSAIDTGLAALLENWGVKVEPAFVLDQYSQPMIYIKDKQAVTHPLFGAQIQPIYDFPDYAAWPIVPARDKDGKIVDPDQIERENPIVSRASNLAFTWVSPISFVDDNISRNEGKKEVLLRSSKDSYSVAIASNTFSVKRTSAEDERDAAVKKQRHDLAAIITGRFRSLWKGKEIPTAAGPDGKVTAPTDEQKNSKREECAAPTSIIVVGDGDFVADGLRQLMVQIEMQRTRNADRAQIKARENLGFINRAIDILAYGGEGRDLIDIKNKRILSREIVKLEENDSRKTKIELINYILVPGLVIVAGLLRFLWRKVATRHAA